MGRVEERMMEWNSLQRRRRPLRLMYWSQQWCTRRGPARPDQTRYALNELADMLPAPVIDMKMVWRVARPASPTTTSTSSSSSMIHIKSPAPDDLSAIKAVGTLEWRVAVDSWASLPAARQSIHYPLKQVLQSNDKTLILSSTYTMPLKRTRRKLQSQRNDLIF